MNCKFCNAELEEDAVYCPQCGKRVDGKKRCNNCGRDINENSVSCTFCGARTDGKYVCPKCGEAFIGAFCPKCGTPVHAMPAQPMPMQAAKRQPNAAVAANADRMTRTLSVIKQSVLYGALCVLFIFSFFVTFSVIAETGIVTLRTQYNSTSFYFLITLFQETADFLAAGSYYPEMYVAMYMNAGISAACIAAIIIVCAVYFAIGTVKFVKSMRAKTEIAMSKYVVMPALLSLALMLFLFSFATGSVSDLENGIKFGLGATSIVNIVLVSVAFAAAAVLQIIIDAKTQKQNLLNSVLNAAGMLLCLLLLITITTNMLGVDARASGNSLSVDGSTPIFFFGILSAIGMTNDAATLDALYGFMTNTTIAFVLYIVIFVLATMALIAFAKGILNRQSSRPRIFACIFSALSTAFSIAYLVVAIILCTQSLAGAATIGPAPICAIIFSVFALVMSIVNCTLLREKNKAYPAPMNAPYPPAQPTA